MIEAAIILSILCILASIFCAVLVVACVILGARSAARFGEVKDE